MASSRRGLVAPQNTFLDSIARKAFTQGSSFLIASARIVDFPIVHSSESFCVLSGFSQNELIQRSCTCIFMHGELTNIATIHRLEQAIQKQTEDQMEILLYKKNISGLSKFAWLARTVARNKSLGQSSTALNTLGHCGCYRQHWMELLQQLTLNLQLRQRPSLP